LLSPQERQFVIETATERKRSDLAKKYHVSDSVTKIDRRWKPRLRRNIEKKISCAFLDFALLSDQKVLFREWQLKTSDLDGKPVQNLTLFGNFIGSLPTLQFDQWGQYFPYRYKTTRTRRGIGLFQERIEIGTRSYRSLSSEMWDKDFPFQILEKKTASLSYRRRAAQIIREAVATGVRLPDTREEAITMRELKREIAERRKAAQIEKDNEVGKGGRQRWENSDIIVWQIPQPPGSQDIRYTDAKRVRLPVLMRLYGYVPMELFEGCARRLGFFKVEFKHPYPMARPPS
jgi:hypothetical protein